MATHYSHPAAPKPKLLALCDIKTFEQVNAVAKTWFDVLHLRDSARCAAMATNDHSVSTVVVDASDNPDASLQLLAQIRAARKEVHRVYMTMSVNLSLIVNG